MPNKDAAAEETRIAAEAHSVAAAAAMEEAKPEMTQWLNPRSPIGAHTASAMAAGPALKIAHRTMAEEALALLKTALKKGDLEGAATLRATAAQEFELSGSDKVAELSELGKMIADASKKKQSEEAAAAQAIKEEENKPKAKFNMVKLLREEVAELEQNLARKEALYEEDPGAGTVGAQWEIFGGNDAGVDEEVSLSPEIVNLKRTQEHGANAAAELNKEMMGKYGRELSTSVEEQIIRTRRLSDGDDIIRTKCREDEDDDHNQDKVSTVGSKKGKGDISAEKSKIKSAHTENASSREGNTGKAAVKKTGYSSTHTNSGSSQPQPSPPRYSGIVPPPSYTGQPPPPSSGVTNLISTSLVESTPWSGQLLTTQKKGEGCIPVEVVETLKPLEEVERVPLPATLESGPGAKGDGPSMAAAGGLMCCVSSCVFVCLMLIPILIIIFSQTFHWAEDKSMCRLWKDPSSSASISGTMSLPTTVRAHAQATTRAPATTRLVLATPAPRLSSPPSSTSPPSTTNVSTSSWTSPSTTNVSTSSAPDDHHVSHPSSSSRATSPTTTNVSTSSWTSPSTTNVSISSAPDDHHVTSETTPHVTPSPRRKGESESITSTTSLPETTQIPCTCNQNFPTFMLISGILQIIFWLFLLIGAIGISARGEVSAAGKGLAASGLCCVGIPLLVINIMMWVFMFQSDKECGESLWGFGVFLLVLSALQACGSKTSLRRPQ